MQSLGDRQKAYEESYDQKIIRRIPVIIRVSGCNFHKLTKKLEKPYSITMIDLMADTMLNVSKEIEGCVFAYQQGNEITFVLRNDQSIHSEPWLNNRIQKIASITAAKTTRIFNYLFDSMLAPPELTGEAVFEAYVFGVPSINETVNNLIYRQQDCIRRAVTTAVQTELLKQVGKKVSIKILQGKSISERVNILRTKCNIEFEEEYSIKFRHGIAAYRVPRIVETPDGQITRQRWSLDVNIPQFSEDRAFIIGILNTGRDIFRAGRDLDKDEEL